ncbi:MAG: ABC transporter substrate-binding protein [Deltaproteobacteria bacterium]|nr:ABC transporter substrate-binding protein [Deltaproteobacteria bacterium]
MNGWARTGDCRSRRWHLVFLALIMVVALVGATSSSRAQVRGEAKPTKIRMAQAIHAISFATVYVARSQRYLEEEGLALDFTIIPGAPATQALMGGSVDFLLHASDQLGKLAAKGVPVLAVQSPLATMTMNLALRKEVAQRKGVAPSSPLDQKLAALKGLTLGVPSPGAAADTYTRWLLRRGGLDPQRDVQIVQIGGGEALVAALKKGQIDGFLLSPPSPEITESGGYGVVVISNTRGEIEEFRTFVHEVLLVKAEYAERNPELVEKVARGLSRGNNFLLDHPEETMKIIQGVWPNADPRILQLGLEAVRPGVPRHGRMTEPQWRNVVKILREAGIVQTGMDTREGRYWTNRFLRGFPR